MKKSTILKFLTIITLIFIGFIGTYAQTLSVNAETLQRHGYDASSNPAAYENTDSVTTGSVTRYYVVPDATANPLYTGVLTGTLASTFTWNTANPVGAGTPAGVIAQVGAIAYGNYRQVTWSGTGTIDVTVQEVSSAGCGSGTTQTIPVAIIPAPTIEFNAASEVARCISGTDGSLNENGNNIALLWTSSVGGTRQLSITYDIACDNPGFTDLTGQTANITETGAGTGTFSLPAGSLDYFGTYTVTVTAINDRISTKSGVDGAPANIAGGALIGTYTITIHRVPVTGPVYHLPNM